MSDYPTNPTRRNELRMKVIGQMMREAKQRADGYGRSSDCYHGRCATSVYGCKLAPTDCLCACHDHQLKAVPE